LFPNLLYRKIQNQGVGSVFALGSSLESIHEITSPLLWENIVLGVRKILLASDLGLNSSRTTEYACLFAKQFQAELHVLHILEDKLSNTPNFGGGLALNSYYHESSSAAESKIHSMFEPAWLLGMQLVVATAEGKPGDQILHYSGEHSIDLIILGTHGRTGLSHVLMGSVAEQVIRHSKCAVVVVPTRG
jgi:universal stress protein A